MVSCVEPFLKKFLELFVEQFEGARKIFLDVPPVPLLLVVSGPCVCCVLVGSVCRDNPGEVTVPTLDAHPCPASQLCSVFSLFENSRLAFLQCDDEGTSYLSCSGVGVVVTVEAEFVGLAV